MKEDIKYEPVIGLETHAELATETKLFCGCAAAFGAPANSQVCPVCMGLPGVLPVVNEKAMEYMLRISLALKCNITREMKFDRKNYYYPDLPKNYQISQQYLPFSRDGRMEIVVDGKKKCVGIDNIHLEEDAGKNIHPEGTNSSLVDLNRAGIPLVEIVTKPDMRSLDEVEVFMNTLKGILLYLDVSDCKMEEGSLRFEVNVSLREKGQDILPPRVEMKNLNSFKTALDALTYEIKRQQSLLEQGKTVQQETRLWDEQEKETRTMRSKEEAQDYRYFPEPDLVPFSINEADIARVQAALPELPQEKKERFMADCGLSDYDAALLVQDKSTADYFEKCLAAYNAPKPLANWILGDLIAMANAKSVSIRELGLAPERLAEMVKLIDDGVISGKIAKEVLPRMLAEGLSAAEIVKKKGLAQISDTSELEKLADEVLAENEKSVADFQSGKTNAISFLIGQVMRKTKGKANPQVVNKLLQGRLKPNM